MKASGSTRRSRNTTTEDLVGSWTWTATALSSGNLCRKSSCPDRLPGSFRERLVRGFAAELGFLLCCFLSHNSMKFFFEGLHQAKLIILVTGRMAVHLLRDRIEKTFIFTFKALTPSAHGIHQESSIVQSPVRTRPHSPHT